jgi:hypothetical protein
MIKCVCGKVLLEKNLEKHLTQNAHIRRISIMNNNNVYYKGFNHKCRSCDEILKNTGEGKPCLAHSAEYKNRYYSRY